MYVSGTVKEKYMLVYVCFIDTLTGFHVAIPPSPFPSASRVCVVFLYAKYVDYVVSVVTDVVLCLFVFFHPASHISFAISCVRRVWIM